MKCASKGAMHIMLVMLSATEYTFCVLANPFIYAQNNVSEQFNATLLIRPTARKLLCVNVVAFFWTIF